MGSGISNINYIIKNTPVSELGGYLIDESKTINVDNIKMLLNAKADIHYNNDAALRNAVNYGFNNVIKVLLEANANVNVDNDYCIETVSSYGWEDTVKVLLEYKADITKVGNNCFKSIMNAKNWGYLRDLELSCNISWIPDYNKYQKILEFVIINLTYKYGKDLALIIFNYI